MTTESSLAADGITLAYDARTVISDLSLAIPPGRISVIVGANACGKSTLLRGLGRLLRPRGGSVLLDGHDIQRLPTRQVAQRLGMLPQQPIAPEGISVVDLVSRGRHPHQRWFRQWSPEDEHAVEEALAATGTVELADRPLDELSGGQRQRVWIALALAQGTELMLLDEPTTFLDMAHQVEVLDLLAELNESQGRTIVAVLHDLNLACRYAHHLVAMRGGAVVAEGPPDDVVTAELVGDVFGMECLVVPDPVTTTPLVVPLPARHRRPTAEHPATAEAPATNGDRPDGAPSADEDATVDGTVSGAGVGTEPGDGTTVSDVRTRPVTDENGEAHVPAAGGTETVDADGHRSPGRAVGAAAETAPG